MTSPTSANNNFFEQFGSNNPLNGFDVGSYAAPTLIDYDGDGDLDIFVGAKDGSITFLKNTGADSQPKFERQTGVDNPFNNIFTEEYSYSIPTLADLDNNGQIDTAVVGKWDGTLRYFSLEADQFIEKTGSDNPLNWVQVAPFSSPEFVDLNGDGWLDLVVGDEDGGLSFFKNNGSNGFTQQTGSDNPLDGIDVGDYSMPTFADIDRDGDLDAIVGELRGDVHYFENTGDSKNPQFDGRLGSTNFFDGFSAWGAAPTLGDLDGDGDIDAVIGGSDGDLTFFINSPTVSLAADYSSIPSEDGAVGAFIVTLSQPAPAGGLTIDYTVESTESAATAGVDYQPLSGQVAIAAGETTAKIEVVPIDDQVYDPNETVTITLSPPVGYVVPAGEATTQLTIADYEPNASLADFNNFVEQSGSNNLLDGVDVGNRSTPTLVDYDGDGDLDLFVGAEDGKITYLEKIGSASEPNYVERTGVDNPFDGVIIDEERSNPTLADLDGDGQIDTAVVGNLAGTLKYFSLEGDQFTEKTGSNNPFDGVTVSSRSAPEFVDLNGDGQLDLVVGDGDGVLAYFRNDGSNGFTQQTGPNNPFDGIDVGVNSTPAFADIDNDGDLDAFVGDFRGGKVNSFENTGNAKEPQFEERLGADNPFDGFSTEGSAPTLGDVDGDGDLDAVIGGYEGDLTYLANVPSVSLSVDSITPSEDSAVGFFIVTSSEPAPEGGLIIEYTVESTEYAATAGVDYQPLSGQVTIAAGETTATIDVVPLEDQAVDPIETVTITLSSPEGYVIPAREATAHLAIADNETDSLVAEAINEPNFKDQWYLWNTPYNLGTPGNDLNVLPVWPDYTGKGVKVGIIDTGIDSDHPDLVANYDPSLSNGVEDTGVYAGHGTATIGLVAATAGNGLGGVGIAHGATVASFGSPSLVEQVNYLSAQIAMDVVYGGWPQAAHFYMGRDFEISAGVAASQVVQEVVEKGRNGLGTVVVSPAGNYRQSHQFNTNYNYVLNSRHMLTVAALNSDGVHTRYSNPGSSLLISAFGSETPYSIFTTDIVGEAGYNSGDYTGSFSGTSASGPMIAGVAALILEANPLLGNRDVQEIFAYSARCIDQDNESWVFNKAHNWNGGGLHHSSDYGFGLVDAHAAVRLAETWQMQHTAANEQQVSIASADKLAIPDADSAGLSDTLWVEQGLNIDYVEVDININHANYSDLMITLTSPTGVVSELVNRVRSQSDNSMGYDPNKVDNQDFKWTFSTTANWGETGVGDWTLSVVDAKTGDTGVLNNWTLNLYGDALTPNDTYIYTDEFAHAKLLNDPTRSLLSDVNGGDNILNAAAVTSDLRLDLTPGSQSSQIAGRQLNLGANTLIETAFGGDGDDLIIGNSADNILDGGRGNDQLKGMAGDDSLLGGKGDDQLLGGLGKDHLTGGAGHDTFIYQKVKDFGDTITDFEIGIDKIDLSALFKGEDDGGKDILEDFGDYVKFKQLGANTKVRVNSQGEEDGKFKTLATLMNVEKTALSANDFVLV